MLRSPGAFFLLCLSLAPASSVAEVQKSPGIQQAFSRLYNFDFRGAHAILDEHTAANPSDPLGPALRAAVYLFFELDRLQILEGEFFADDKRIIDKKKLQPDPTVKAQFQKALDDAQSLAEVKLSANPDDQNALFAMCVTQSVLTDYTALVEKKQLSSLSTAKRSYGYAKRLLMVNPEFYDAYLTTGFTEYLVGSLPFIIRWFVRFDDVKGNKDEGIRRVQLVAKSGHYLKPYAKILLSIAYLREKQLQESEKLLADLAHEYPQNQLIRRELAKISAKLRNGESY